MLTSLRGMASTVGGTAVSLVLVEEVAEMAGVLSNRKVSFSTLGVVGPHVGDHRYKHGEYRRCGMCSSSYSVF